ncbi:hypothetical protein STEG23_022012 [Scotinomys teguina]
MDWLGQRTHCGPNVAAPNPRQPYLGDFTADGLDQLTLCWQSPGFGTPAAPVQVVAPGDSDGGDFTADGLDQLTLCSQSPGFGTPAAPVQVVAPGGSDGGDFTADGLDQLTLCLQSPGFGTPAAPVQVVAPGDSDGGDFTADGLDQLTLCSKSPGFGTPAAPVQEEGSEEGGYDLAPPVQWCLGHLAACKDLQDTWYLLGRLFMWTSEVGSVLQAPVARQAFQPH